ncbi:MAG TPA: hypothetical protein ENK08_01375 [Chloroflexi bacterium]|nr:hypothetical protein [Chloroflexota bacterium]
MEFFNIGPGELLFIALLAILVVGPKRSVQLMQQAGRLLARLQQEWRTIQRDVMTEVQSVRDEISLDTSDWITSPRSSIYPLGGLASVRGETTADEKPGEEDGTDKATDGTTSDAAGGDSSHS